MRYLDAVTNVVVIVAALLAAFPLWQYWTEAPDRERERLALEVQVLQACTNARLRDFTVNRVWNDGDDVAHGFREPDAQSVAADFRAKCLELGFEPRDWTIQEDGTATEAVSSSGR